MTCGHSCQNKCTSQKTSHREPKQAFAQVELIFPDAAISAVTVPYAEVSHYSPSQGVKSAELVKVFSESALLPDSCAAYKIVVAFDECYFAKGFVPLLNVTACAPDEHSFNASVRPICGLSNNQHAYFRVDLYPSASCYPTCVTGAGITVPGKVTFNIHAAQGNECL
jgi:hypothetical protein